MPSPTRRTSRATFNTARATPVLLAAFAAAILLGLLATAPVAAETPYPVEWSRQLGTSEHEQCTGLAVDAVGNAYISGLTYGSLDGNTNAGDFDAFVTKYDAAGNKLWTQQLGSPKADWGYNVRVNHAGDIFVGGYTTGSMDGNPVNSGAYAFLVKLSPAGDRLWTDQFHAYGWHVAVDDAGNAFLGGSVYGNLDGNIGAGDQDAFVTKYDSAGNKLWTRLLGSTDRDWSDGLTVDRAGNVFVSGTTRDHLDGHTLAGFQDAFLAKYDPSGNLLWTRQFGTSNQDNGGAVAVDSLGNAYMTGMTTGDLDGNTSSGGPDVFVTKFDPDGNKLWTRQFGSPTTAYAYDWGYGIAVDGWDDIFVSGFTAGSLHDNTHIGQDDAFLIKLDAAGNLLWTQQIGTTNDEEAEAVAVDPLGNAYISGWTFGSLDGHTNAGAADAFLIKFASGALLGDLDGDGDVDNVDIGTATGNFTASGGSTAMTYLDGDIDGDGDIDNQDIGTITGAFTGSMTGMTPAFASNPANTIPEPTTLALIALLAVSLPNRTSLTAQRISPLHGPPLRGNPLRSRCLHFHALRVARRAVRD